MPEADESPSSSRWVGWNRVLLRSLILPGWEIHSNKPTALGCSLLASHAFQPEAQFIVSTLIFLILGSNCFMQNLRLNCKLLAKSKSLTQVQVAPLHLNTDMIAASKLCDISQSANKALVIRLGSRAQIEEEMHIFHITSAQLSAIPCKKLF